MYIVIVKPKPKYSNGLKTFFYLTNGKNRAEVIRIAKMQAPIFFEPDRMYNAPKAFPIAGGTVFDMNGPI